MLNTTARRWLVAAGAVLAVAAFAPQRHMGGQRPAPGAVQGETEAQAQEEGKG